MFIPPSYFLFIANQQIDGNSFCGDLYEIRKVPRTIDVSAITAAPELYVRNDPGIMEMIAEKTKLVIQPALK